MKVQRISVEGGGSRIEPGIDSRASELEKLEWKAAVVEVDSGIHVGVRPAQYSKRVRGIWIEQHGYFDVGVGQSVVGPLDFQAAWDVMIGIEMGATAAAETHVSGGEQ